MVDIQSEAPEIGEEKQKKKETAGQNIMDCPLLWAAIISSVR